MGFGQLHPNLRIRIVVGSVQRFLHIMVMPLMTLYLANRYGVALAGVLMLLVGVFDVVGTLLGGHLSDHRGRRPILLAGEFVVALAYALMAVAALPSVDVALLVYVGFVASSMAASLATPANDAMIVDVTDPDIRKFVYTINYWAINLALACGVLLGAFLYTDYFPHLLAAVALGSVAVFVVTLVWISETAPQLDAQEDRGVGSYLRNFFGGYQLVLRDKIFAALLLAATLRMALEVQINYYVNVRVSEEMPEQRLFSIGSFDATFSGVEVLGILRAENTLLIVLLTFLVLGVLKKLDDRPRLYAGVLLFTAGTMVLGVSNSAWVLIAAMFVITVGELLNVPVQQAMLADMVPEKSRTRYMAVFNLNVRMALLIASLLLTVGSVLRPWGMAALYGVFGLVIMLAYRPVLRARNARLAAEPQQPKQAEPTAG
ncbi:MFS transporter [Micromonospora echinofusca]|uniref:MFS transporter n=1 Tax=Micromonospora echinofusca TaxID=47858 RepID=A0ABS3W1B3_MICEH|nr:MFS transporter [Micromonospora echinofusca]MBO4210567.1 MFS transporter [Micromonospora echinofusca]